MPKIFISFFNAVHNPADPQAMPCFYESFIKELAERGNELLIMHHYIFARDFGPLPENVRRHIADFSPDLAIIFNNAFYDLSEYFDFPIYVYEVDSVLYYSNKDVLKSKKDRFRYIVPQRTSVESIRQHLGVDKAQILYTPFFTSVRRENIPKTMNISFIGTRFVPYGHDGKTAWNRFMCTGPSSVAVECFKQALETVRRTPYIPQQKLMEQFQSEEFDAAYFLNRDEMVDSLSGSIRILTLSEVADLGLVIFGTKSWVTENCADPHIPLAYDSRAVYSLKHNQDVYNASRLAINVNHVQATTGFSWRVCDIMASDACLVSEYKPDFERCFPGVPIPLFTNRYEARELCRKLLDNKNMRRDIIARCNEIIDAKFRFENLVPLLEDFFKVSLREEKSSIPARIENVSDLPMNSVNHVVVDMEAPLDFRKRYKLFCYLALLLAAQIPVIGLCFSAERRKKLLKKVNKYWR